MATKNACRMTKCDCATHVDAASPVKENRSQTGKHSLYHNNEAVKFNHAVAIYKHSSGQSPKGFF